MIRTLRDKENALVVKLKTTTDDLGRSEGTNIKVNLRNHVETRRKHLDEVKAVLDNLSGHIAKVNANEE